MTTAIGRTVAHVIEVLQDAVQRLGVKINAGMDKIYKSIQNLFAHKQTSPISSNAIELSEVLCNMARYQENDSVLLPKTTREERVTPEVLKVSSNPGKSSFKGTAFRDRNMHALRNALQSVGCTGKGVQEAKTRLLATQDAFLKQYDLSQSSNETFSAVTVTLNQHLTDLAGIRSADTENTLDKLESMQATLEEMIMNSHRWEEFVSR